MDLRELGYFVALGEELHFRRAAARLGMTQPPLSRAIGKLEAEFGAELIARGDRRNLRLTPAGTALLEEGQRLLAQAAILDRQVRRVVAGETGLLRIGFVPWSVMRALPRAMVEFQRRWPGIELRIDEQMSRSQVEALHQGTLDLGIFNRFLVDTAGLETLTLETTRLTAAVPAASPLARKRGVRLRDLADCTFLLFPQTWVPDYFGAFEAACRAAGFSPRVGQSVRQPYTMFNLVANGLGVGLVQDSARHLPVAGVVLVPIVDLDAPFWSEIAAAWVPSRLTPPLRSFIDGLRRAASDPSLRRRAARRRAAPRD